MLKYSNLLGLIVLLISCNSHKTGYVQKIDPPIRSYDVPFSSFSFDADSVVSIHMETGTSIQFDPSSFETVMGKPVKGKITINVREFHKANELFRAGIPLTVDENRKEVLQSAGMIEVRAFHNGEMLKLKKGRFGAISLAGFRPAEGYSLYQLGDDIRWRVKDSFETTKNDRMVFSPPVEIDTMDNGFEIVADLKEVPQLIPFKGLTWVAVGNSANKEKMEAALRIRWDSVVVLPVNKNRNRFQLIFSKTIHSENNEPIQRKWSVLATPKLNGRSMVRLLKEKEKIDRLIAAEKRRIEKEADMLNSFRINQLGIWNIDKIMNWANTRMVSLQFDFASSLHSEINQLKIFMVLEEENSVVPVLSQDWNKLVLPLDRKVHFIAILPGDKAVIADAAEVAKALGDPSGSLKLKTRAVQKTDIGM